MQGFKIWKLGVSVALFIDYFHLDDVDVVTLCDCVFAQTVTVQQLLGFVVRIKIMLVLNNTEFGLLCIYFLDVQLVQSKRYTWACSKLASTKVG